MMSFSTTWLLILVMLTGLNAKVEGQFILTYHLLPHNYGTCPPSGARWDNGTLHFWKTEEEPWREPSIGPHNFSQGWMLDAIFAHCVAMKWIHFHSESPGFQVNAISVMPDLKIPETPRSFCQDHCNAVDDGIAEERFWIYQQSAPTHLKYACIGQVQVPYAVGEPTQSRLFTEDDSERPTQWPENDRERSTQWPAFLLSFVAVLVAAALVCMLVDLADLILFGVADPPNRIRLRKKRACRPPASIHRS